MGPLNGRRAHAMALVATEASLPGDPQGTAGDLRRLCSAAVKALPMWGAGLSLMSEAGVRGVAAASDPSSERVDELQFTLGEGPCMDAFTTRRPVLVPDLDQVARRAGPSTPLQRTKKGCARCSRSRCRSAPPGSACSTCIATCRRCLTADELAQSLTFADVATSMLLDGQEEAPTGAAASGLAEVLEYRYELYQAQGMVMVQLGVSLVEALAVMRAYAYSHDRDLADVARDVVSRRLRLDQDARRQCLTTAGAAYFDWEVAHVRCLH